MREILDIPVGDLMSTAVVTVTPETSVEALTDLMTKHDYNRLSCRHRHRKARRARNAHGPLQGLSVGVPTIHPGDRGHVGVLGRCHHEHGGRRALPRRARDQGDCPHGGPADPDDPDRD